MVPWTVGQEVFVVNKLDRREFTYPAKVTKIGRRWVTIERGDLRYLSSDRFDRETGYLDGRGYSSPGRVYASEAAWKDHALAVHYWRRIARCRSDPGIDIPAANVRRAAELLGIDLEEPTE